jgi:hypothetical protein
MINNPDWQNPKIKPYHYQLSLGCIEEIDCDTCLIMQEILSDKIEDEEFFDFALDNLEELTSYIIKGNLNIRIHRDITGEMWVGMFWINSNFKGGTNNEGRSLPMHLN